MSMIVNKADARKTVRDASAEMAKSGGDVAPVARKTAHDASQPSSEAVRKVVEPPAETGSARMPRRLNRTSRRPPRTCAAR